MVNAMRKRKMRSRVVAQIHDSIIADVQRDEVDDYLELAADITTNRLRKAWPWITVPFTVEAELAEGSWRDKKEIKIG